MVFVLLSFGLLITQNNLKMQLPLLFLNILYTTLINLKKIDSLMMKTIAHVSCNHSGIIIIALHCFIIILLKWHVLLAWYIMGRVGEQKSLIILWSVTVPVQTGGLQLISAHLCGPRITLSVMNVGLAQRLLQRRLLQKQTLPNQQTNRHTHVRAVCLCTSFMVDLKSSPRERTNGLIDRYIQ